MASSCYRPPCGKVFGSAVGGSDNAQSLVTDLVSKKELRAEEPLNPVDSSNGCLRLRAQRSHGVSCGFTLVARQATRT